jgi:hypothetical protein
VQTSYGVMIEDGTAIVLAYVLVSIGVIVAFLWVTYRAAMARWPVRPDLRERPAWSSRARQG